MTCEIVATLPKTSAAEVISLSVPKTVVRKNAPKARLLLVALHFGEISQTEVALDT